MENNKIKLDEFQNWLSWKNRLGRVVWNIVWTFFFRPFGTKYLNFWRISLLRLFGAKIGKNCFVAASAKVWAPWNLVMVSNCLLSHKVNCYNTGLITIGDSTIISQGAYLCPGSHDIEDPAFPMICAPLTIEDQVWIATEAFVGGMGITVGQGAVVGARACVFKDVEPWSVVGGNPAKFIKKREIRK